MSMTVSRRKDNRTPRVLMHRVADIRGGVSVSTSELGGDYLREGSVLSVPVNGISHVVKIGNVAEAAGASDKIIKVKKGSCLKVGDSIMAVEAGVATVITAIDDTTSKQHDIFTLKAALGALEIDSQIVEAEEESTGASKLKYTPLAIAGTGKNFDTKSNLDMDAWLIGVTKGNPLPAFIAKYLKGIINY